MEIAALVSLLGASFAGATTPNGIKQGLCAGLGASVIVLGIKIVDPKFSLDWAVMHFGGVAIISLVGGWFGGQLFPPLSPRAIAASRMNNSGQGGVGAFAAPY